ncbi:hypothetical protein A374_06676 [Fictibacillus macauensis ZFHKF-1]|uniref:Uncharacterized protein n=1 Tax=Fictibacillus macauensis ZFHKF-1 TaxID=1196324 RepID=I8UHG3_9BACL|nr:hypothetical protein [Fictibacillus macauensis]EIT86263.1 hypothetical protein A374_06676 [Fictibacillus macauensis ZFHKF-1]
MSNLSFAIAPTAFQAFDNEAQYEETGRAWGLFQKTPKHEFWYKTRTEKFQVTLEGYEEHDGFLSAVVAFTDGTQTCIHPSYLKEMQSPSFGKEQLELTEVTGESAGTEAKPAPVKKAPEKCTKKPAASKQLVVSIPEDKCHWQATIAGFTTVPNPFSDDEDEIVLLKDVKLLGEDVVPYGEAWCSYSKTLKKHELQEEDVLTFDAKMVKKKLTNHENRLKINNPSKIKKNEN